MSNIKKVSMLYLFLSIATFFSCGDEGVAPINSDAYRNYRNIRSVKFYAYDIDFDKGKYWIGKDGLPYSLPGPNINECTIGDSVTINCSFGLPLWDFYYNMDGLKITVKIKSSKTGDFKRVTLMEPGNAVYILEVPKSGIFGVSFIGRFYISYVGGRGDVLKVSPDGDILIAQIGNGKQKITKTLTIKGI